MVDRRLEEPVRRLFFALWPDEAVCNRLQRIVDKLRGQLPARWVPAENFHITLAFLGPVAESGWLRLGRIDPMWPEAFMIRLEDLRLMRRRQMVWIAPRTEPRPLLGLVDVLRAELAPLGMVSRVNEPFCTHLTLARRVTGPWPGLSPFNPIEWTIRSVNLVESVLDRSGVHYLKRNAWRLRAMPLDTSMK